jgi:dienelactone hydrolase
VAVQYPGRRIAISAGCLRNCGRGGGVSDNFRDALSADPYSSGSLGYETGTSTASDSPVVSHWQSPAAMPHDGRLVSVHIPGTVSHFHARAAVVYLPPAALVPDPPVLPVMIMMSGQPGSPSEVFTSGELNLYLNTFADAHNGLAPIVIAPDQLGKPGSNPMCVNSPLGNVATYLTVDVMHWIHTHLRVSGDRSAWAVAGFSEGATCAIQLSAGDPRLFSATLAVSSEIAPTIGATTVPVAFHGSEAAYTAQKPLTLLAKNAPFTGDLTYFAVGANDAKYRPYAVTLAAAAAEAGMTTHLLISPGTSHDWNTVHYAFRQALPGMLTHLGL